MPQYAREEHTVEFAVGIPDTVDENVEKLIVSRVYFILVRRLCETLYERLNLYSAQTCSYYAAELVRQ